jgi:hypothetical protein
MSWVIPEYGGKEVLSDYEFGQTLGCGTFGVTRLVTHRKSARPWACKTIKASIAASAAAQQDVRHEVAILRHLRGAQGIVALRGVYEDERSIHLVMELCSGGDLLDYISRLRRLGEDEAADVTAMMLATLRHCHRCVFAGGCVLRAWCARVPAGGWLNSPHSHRRAACRCPLRAAGLAWCTATSSPKTSCWARPCYWAGRMVAAAAAVRRGTSKSVTLACRLSWSQDR